jgi:hypothetical protein
MKILDLFEARKNWEHPAQEKVYGADKLRKYADDSNIYISYTMVDKLGINPNNQYYTPTGIYTYPLKQVFHQMDAHDDVQNVPFAGSNKFIWVCKATKPVMELSTYDNLHDDIAKITAYLNKTNHWQDSLGLTFSSAAELVNFAISQANKSSNMDASRMWNITRIASGRNTSKWNYILRVVLGYAAVSDKTGLGIIHPSEPIQTLFFSVDALKTIDKIINKNPNTDDASNALGRQYNLKNPNMVNRLKRVESKEAFEDAYSSLSNWWHYFSKNISDETPGDDLYRHVILAATAIYQYGKYINPDTMLFEFKLFNKIIDKGMDAIGPISGFIQFAHESVHSNSDDKHDAIMKIESYMKFIKKMASIDSKFSKNIPALETALSALKQSIS